MHFYRSQRRYPRPCHQPNADRLPEAISGPLFGHPSLGYLRYLSAMKYCTAVVGNSSSGLLEAPALKTPTVNIGDRQQGRVRTKSVKDCTPTKESIIEALNQACEPSFLYELETMEVPFEMPGTSNRIKKILAATDLDGIIKKKFF